MCKKIVLSSSATVYGDAVPVPYTEDAPRNATNPYGRNKLMVGVVLSDMSVADPAWRFACLRYNNPAGAHKSGLIGVYPEGIPNNLMSFVDQVAIGRRESLNIFCDNYSTPDGTCIRDFNHVMDLAEEDCAALRNLDKQNSSITVNLGMDEGISILEMVLAFERARGRKNLLKVVGRRSGDQEQYWANPEKANKLLAWKADRNIDPICSDAWKWQLLSQKEKSCVT